MYAQRVSADVSVYIFFSYNILLDGTCANRGYDGRFEFPFKLNATSRHYVHEKREVFRRRRRRRRRRSAV